MKRNHRALLVTTITILNLGFVSIASAQDKPIAPLYLITGFDTITTGVTWDETAIKRVLPPGVTPVKDMTGGINIYHAADGYHLGPYSASYLWVDIEGFDAPDGTKGRWMLAGVYGPNERITSQFQQFLGLPIRNGSARHDAIDGGLRAVGSHGDKEVVKVEAKIDSSKCKPGGGTVNFLTKTPDGKMMLMQPVFWGEVCPGEIVSARMTAPDGDPFAQFPLKKVNWTIQFRGSVSVPTLVAKP